MPTLAPLDLDGHCMAAAFLGDVPYFALADGSLHWLDHGHKITQLHDGLLCIAAELQGDSFVSGGEDGRIVRFRNDGSAETLAENPGKWINCIASGPQSSIAYGVGRRTRDCP